LVEREDLLVRHTPHLKYDSTEAFYADSPAEWTDREWSVLQRRNEDDTPGDVIASGAPDDGTPKLDIDFLGETHYGDGTEVRRTDFTTWTRSDHREQFRLLHQRPDYRNRIYGRTQRGRDGRLWLQYWFYYLYNDYNMAGGFGLHEGDWEGIQLLIAEDRDEPELAVYAQHTNAERRDWHGVELLDHATPVVYPGRGSHASYFESGSHRVGPVWWDYCDGAREPPDLKLEILDGGNLPGWVLWPGVWGATFPRHPPVEQSSPPGPRRPNDRWDYPEVLLKGATTSPSQPPVPAIPQFDDPTRAGDRLRLGFDLSSYGDVADAPERLVVTVNRPQPPDETTREPPRTYTVAVGGVSAGRVDLRDRLDPNAVYEVSVSAATADNRPTAARTWKLPIPGLSVGGRAIAAWGRFGDWLGRVGRRLRGREADG
jgi:hypothetical protein